MFRKVTLTLLVYLVAIVAISSLVEAKSFDSVNRRDHENLKRFIKKRAVLPGLAQGVGAEPTVTDSAAGADSTTSSSASSSSSATSSSSSSVSTTSSSSSTSSATSSSSASTSSSSSLPSSVSTTTGSSSTTTTSSSSSSSSSSPSTTSSAATTVTTPATHTTQPQAAASDDVETSVVGGTVVTLTRSVSAPTSTSNASVSGATSSTSAKTAGITVVIVIASVVGGIAILWTIFRKWKLGRSSKFDQRMQPINWQPEDLPTHRRGPSNTSSFHSGIHGNGSDLGHTSSDHSHGAYGAADLPPLAPVGGYADLARGPSPQPPMQEALSRGPSVTRNYNAGYGAGY